jgi:hypothetical protein
MPPGIYLAIALGVLAVVIISTSINRTFDGDEGFYLLATRLVAEGQQPYEDFYFQHGPLLPYVYAVWHEIFGASLLALRLFSGVLTIVLGGLLSFHVARRTDSRPLGVVAAVLFATSALAASWFPTVKTYPLAALFLFSAYVVVARAEDRASQPGPARWLVAGILTGLSADTRLYILALTPVFLAYAAAPQGAFRQRAQRVASYAGGLLLGLLPSLIFFVADPGRFVFDTFDSQTARGGDSFFDALVQKLRVLAELVSDGGLLLLTLSAAVLGVAVVASRRRPPMALAIAAALVLVSLVPDPTYAQYFSMVVPFLVVAAVDGWTVAVSAFTRSTDSSAPRSTARSITRAIGIGALVLYVAVFANKYDVLMQQDVVFLTMEDISAVSDAIDEHTDPGEVVISFWPGHLYESEAEQLHGIETDFADAAIRQTGVSQERAREYEMISAEEVESMIRAGSVPTVVFGSYGAFGLRQPFLDILAESSYTPVETVGPVTVYKRDASAAPPG